MADQTTELRRINWSECFPFTNIFRTFKLTVAPSKLALALAGLLLTGLAGWILDAIWSSKCQPVEDEVNAYWQVADVKTWREKVRESNKDRLRDAYNEMAEPFPAGGGDEFLSKPNAAIDKAEDALSLSYKQRVNGVEDRAQIANEGRQAARIHHDLESLRPKGVFKSFRLFETTALRQMLDAARGLNFMGDFNVVVNSRAGGLASQAGAPGDVTLPVPSIKTGPKGFGVVPSVLLMLRGFQWLFAEHWFFAVLFLLAALAIWSFFGGAICRMAALNFARDEHISVKAAMSFACRKFLGFATAPLLPVGMVVAVGFCLFLGGMFMAVPYLGELIGGLAMGLGLIGGFVITLVILGAAGGFGLMWPTIAVEGSDSFDAMSRSYSYLYSRPWRAGFYAVVATVYGSLCYVFVRFFVLILLKSTRFFVNLGVRVFETSRPGAGFANAKKLDAIWPHPSFEHLSTWPSSFGMEHWDKAGAVLVAIWVFLIVAALCAFLVSFFLSGSTIIYYLLRREVDATDLQEVFVEGDITEPQPATPPSETPAPAPPAPPPPAES